MLSTGGKRSHYESFNTSLGTVVTSSSMPRAKDVDSLKRELGVADDHIDVQYIVLDGCLTDILDGRSSEATQREYRCLIVPELASIARQIVPEYKSASLLWAQGYVVIPTFSLPRQRAEWRDQIRTALLSTRCTDNPGPSGLALGGVNACEDPSDAFHLSIGRLRAFINEHAKSVLLRPYSVIRGEDETLCSEMLDSQRMCYHIDLTNPSSGSWAREVCAPPPESTLQKDDEILGGWTNIGEEEQYFSCVPGTHLDGSMSAFAAGSVTMSVAEITAYGDRIEQVCVPSGHAIYFFRHLMHEVFPTPTRPSMTRVPHDFRLTTATESLFCPADVEHPRATARGSCSDRYSSDERALYKPVRLYPDESIRVFDTSSNVSAHCSQLGTDRDAVSSAAKVPLDSILAAFTRLATHRPNHSDAFVYKGSDGVTIPVPAFSGVRMLDQSTGPVINIQLQSSVSKSGAQKPYFALSGSSLLHPRIRSVLPKNTVVQPKRGVSMEQRPTWLRRFYYYADHDSNQRKLQWFMRAAYAINRMHADTPVDRAPPMLTQPKETGILQWDVPCKMATWMDALVPALKNPEFNPSVEGNRIRFHKSCISCSDKLLPYVKASDAVRWYRLHAISYVHQFQSKSHHWWENGVYMGCSLLSPSLIKLFASCTRETEHVFPIAWHGHARIGYLAGKVLYLLDPWMKMDHMKRPAIQRVVDLLTAGGREHGVTVQFLDRPADQARGEGSCVAAAMYRVLLICLHGMDGVHKPVDCAVALLTSRLISKFRNR